MDYENYQKIEKAMEDHINKFNEKVPTRKEKLAELKSQIESSRKFLAKPGEITPEQLQIVYKEIMHLSNEMEILRMNKYNSAFFEYIPSNTYNRSQRRKMMKG